MNKPYYSDYVKHALRFYTRNLTKPRFKSEVDKHNWVACDYILSGCCDRDRDILISVYGKFDTLADNVYEVSKQYNIRQSVIWDLMKAVERKIARKRGLI